MDRDLVQGCCRSQAGYPGSHNEDCLFGVVFPYTSTCSEPA